MRLFIDSLFRISALMLLVGEMSCTNEDVTIPYEDPVEYGQFVYIGKPEATSHSIAYRPAANESGYEIYEGEESLIFELPPVRCTKPAEKDIKITLDFDQTLLDEYNAGITSGTAQGMEAETYDPMPNARFEPAEVVIPAGAYEAADTVRVHVDPADFFADPSKTRFALPVSIGMASEGRIAGSGKHLYTYTAQFNAIKCSMKENGQTKSVMFSKETGEAVDYNSEIDLGKIVVLDAPASMDCRVTLAIDPDAELGWSYSYLDKLTAGVELTTGEVTIHTGETECSESVKVSVPADVVKSFIGESRVIPVTIRSVDSKDMVLSGGSAVSYGLVIEAVYEPSVFASNASEFERFTACEEPGTVSDFFIQEARKNDTPPYDDGEDVTNPLRPYYKDINGYCHVSPNEWITITFREEVTLAGFKANYNDIYNAKKWEVDISTDKEEWTELGETESLVDENPQYVKLKNPARAKYIRLTLVDYYHYDTSLHGGIEFYKIGE